MTPQQYQKLSEVFLSALETPPSDRKAWLSNVCGADVEFRKRLECMLAADECSGIALDQPIRDAGFEILASQERHASDGEMVGKTVGKFQIVREIGGGGMGVVYEAMRSDLAGAKPVAVKIVKRGMDTNAFVRRFQLERRILAKFDHLYIAQLYDSGATDDGRPYFAMEYVAGQPIDEFCETRRLSVAERLRLFCKVGEAVQYAHQNLIVHRDLKPGNILVALDSMPKLLDFGIAKALISDFEHDDAFTHMSLTQTGRPILTPAYASPEQVRSEPITVTTDIYALGGLLYALLTGCPPHSFSNSSFSEIRRVVCEVEPEPPSNRITLQHSQTFGDDSPEKLRRLLSGDLDAIALTALRKDAQRRYATVEHFLADVRRHLNHLPVSARRDRFAYRIGKYVRRNRLRLTTGTVVALSILGGTGVSVWQSARATAQGQASERRAQDLRQITSFLLSQFNDEMEKLPGSTKAREALVKESLKYLDRLDQEGGTSPAQRREMALGYMKLGDVQGNSAGRASLGDLTGALASYRHSLAILERLLEENSNDSQTLFDIALISQKVGVVALLSFDPAVATPHYERAIAIYRRMAAQNANDGTALANLAACQVTSGDIGLELGEYDRVFEKLTEAEAIFEKFAVESPTDPTLQVARAMLYARFSLVFENVGDIGEKALGDANWIMAAHRRRLHYAYVVHQIGERQLAAAPHDASLQYNHMKEAIRVGFGLVKVKRPKEALRLFDSITGQTEEMMRQDARDKDSAYALTQLQQATGRANHQLGNKAAARSAYQKALRLLEQENLNISDNVEWRRCAADIYEELAGILLQTGAQHDAIPYLHEAFRLRDQISLSKPASLLFGIEFATTFHHLAEALFQTDAGIARTFVTQNFRECRSRADNSHASPAELIACAWNLSHCPIEDLRNFEDARTYFKKAMSLTGGNDFQASLAEALNSSQHIQNKNAEREKSTPSSASPIMRLLEKDDDQVSLK